MIYVQSAAGLTQISPKLTKEKIIAALGFTPADKNSFYEDESGALVIADEQGYVIARIDANGLTTTQVSANAIALNGEDLATKLQELADKVPDIDLTGYATEKYVDDALANLDIEIPETDLSKYALNADVEANKVLTDAHAADVDIHVTAENKAAWNAKSDFDGDFNSLSNAPHIVNDNEDEVVICDSQGNVILRATAEGLNVAAIYVNGEAIHGGPATFYIRMDDDVAPTPHKFIPGMNFKDWVNSEYCTADIAYSTNSNYYRFSMAGLAILEDFNDYKTGAGHTTSIYAGKTFYCRADGVEPVVE